jgi:hypothetical protein
MPNDFFNMQESLNRSIHAVLAYYFTGGNTRDINSVAVDFTDCDIVHDIRRLQNDTSDKPMIAIVGSRISSHERVKCNVGAKVGFEIRVSTVKSVFVKVNHTEDFTGRSGKRLADRVYDQLSLVFSTQIARIAQHDIFIPMLSPIPAEVPSEQEAILRGSLTFDARFLHTMDEVTV